MFYKAELDFLRRALEKCHVQNLLIRPEGLLKDSVDLGLRVLLGREPGICAGCPEVIEGLKDRVVYLFSAACGCKYVFFLLPEAPERQLLLIGPFLSMDMEDGQILEVAERMGVPPPLTADFEKYLRSMSILSEGSHVFTLVESFCDLIWQDGPFDTVEINVPQRSILPPVLQTEETVNPMWKMDLMEKRYAAENEMMAAVSQGQVHKAHMLFSAFSPMNFEKRLSDPLRNMKNYCIIMNTLMRKSAEQGGVHPVFLDGISSAFARKIETMTGVGMVQGLMLEMFDSYCRLVRKHSVKKYSPPVQKAIIAIETDLARDLSLRALSSLLNISASYLSSLFKKETETTITEYVNQRRVECAAGLLVSSKLQIQTIAQYCGIIDVQYFSRLFKKIKGISPNEYRKLNHQKA